MQNDKTVKTDSLLSSRSAYRAFGRIERAAKAAEKMAFALRAAAATQEIMNHGLLRTGDAFLIASLGLADEINGMVSLAGNQRRSATDMPPAGLPAWMVATWYL